MELETLSLGIEGKLPAVAVARPGGRGPAGAGRLRPARAGRPGPSPQRAGVEPFRLEAAAAALRSRRGVTPGRRAAWPLAGRASSSVPAAARSPATRGPVDHDHHAARPRPPRRRPPPRRRRTTRRRPPPRPPTTADPRPVRRRTPVAAPRPRRRRLPHRPRLRPRRPAVLRRAGGHDQGGPGRRHPGVRHGADGHHRGRRRLQRAGPARPGRQPHLRHRPVRVHLPLGGQPDQPGGGPLDRLRRRGPQPRGHRRAARGRQLLPQGGPAGVRARRQAVRHPRRPAHAGGRRRHLRRAGQGPPLQPRRQRPRRQPLRRRQPGVGRRASATPSAWPSRPPAGWRSPSTGRPATPAARRPGTTSSPPTSPGAAPASGPPATATAIRSGGAACAGDRAGVEQRGAGRRADRRHVRQRLRAGALRRQAGLLHAQRGHEGAHRRQPARHASPAATAGAGST